jgi:hypothetical protein
MDADRLRVLRLLRLTLLALLVLWFFSPPEWRYAVPLWLPFVTALLLEVQFFVGGLRADGPVLRRDHDRGPQRIDVERFGWPGGEEPEDDDEFWDSPPAPSRRAAKGRVRRLVEPALVLAAVALVVFAVNVRRGWTSLDGETQARVERTLSQEAQRIAGHRASVRCDVSGRHVGYTRDADGLAVVGGRDAWLTPGICYRLYRLAEHADHGSFSATGRAIAVLAHEAWHLRGVADEGVVNCYAFQSGVEVGVRLGLSRSTAERMMRQQLADNALDSSGDRRYLVPPGCRDGGRYDLRPGSATFP